MKISAINGGVQTENFKANLFVSESVRKIVKSNEKAFLTAAKNYNEWLRNDQKQVLDTVILRKNSSLHPNLVFEHDVPVTTYSYPHEETGYTYLERRKEYENMEFQMGNKICGFWFDATSSAEKLLEDFKNVFYHLSQK